MKRTIVLLFLVVLSKILWSQEQLPLHVLGIRSEIYGPDSEPGIELSYQTGLSEVVRAEIDFGFQRSIYSDFMHISPIIQGTWSIQNYFSWFIGLGFQIGYFQTYYEDLTLREGFGGGPCIQLGIAYDFSKFNVPFSLSLDTRPILPMLSDDLLINGIAYAVGLRYIFKE
jgi:hypothetical protein